MDLGALYVFTGTQLMILGGGLVFPSVEEEVEIGFSFSEFVTDTSL